MRARSLHLLGNLTSARDYIGRMLDRYVPPSRQSHVARFQYDQRLVARITLARVLWLQGYADQALREIGNTVETARSNNHALTLAHVLSDAACPVALMAGDLDLAAEYTAMLHEQTKTHSLDVWNTYADGFAGEIMIRRGNLAAGLDDLRAAIETLAQAGFVLYQTFFLAGLAQGLIVSGQIPEAIAAVDRAIASCDRTGEAWLLAELHRIRAEAQLRGTEAHARKLGEASLLHSMEIARSQGALAWELRTSISLAKVLRQTNRSAAARDLISDVLAKITEGSAMADHAAATAILADIERTTA